jgi:hypothetical protein
VRSTQGRRDTSVILGLRASAFAQTLWRDKSTRQASMGFVYVYILQSKADPRRFHSGIAGGLLRLTG